MPKTCDHYDDNNNEIKLTKNVNKTTILNLNDDCLLEVLKYLNLSEWINLSKLNERFYVLVINFLLKDGVLCLKDVRNHHNIRKVLRLFGPFANHIEATSNDIQYAPAKVSHSNELLSLLSKRCRSDRLRSLKISIDASSVGYRSCDNLAPKLARLEHFSIKWIKRLFPLSHSRGFDDQILRSLLPQAKQLRSIECINLHFNSTFFHEFDLRNLQHISLETCPVINLTNFKSAMHKIGKQLKSFEWNNSAFAQQTHICETIINLCDIISTTAPNLVNLTLLMNYNSVYCQTISKKLV